MCGIIKMFQNARSVNVNFTNIGDGFSGGLMASGLWWEAGKQSSNSCWVNFIHLFANTNTYESNWYASCGLNVRNVNAIMAQKTLIFHSKYNFFQNISRFYIINKRLKIGKEINQSAGVCSRLI